MSVNLCVVGQTLLVPGDIAIVAYNARLHSRNCNISFVLLRDIVAGTTINFTDNGWTSPGVLRSTEGTDVWTASTALSAGTVILYPFTNVRLSTKGDQVLLFQGTVDDPNFIFAINNNNTGRQQGWNSMNTSS